MIRKLWAVIRKNNFPGHKIGTNNECCTRDVLGDINAMVGVKSTIWLDQLDNNRQVELERDLYRKTGHNDDRTKLLKY